MGFFKKALIVLVIFIAIAVAVAPSSDEQNQALANEIDAISNAQLANDISPAELQKMFSIGSEYTDVQRDNKEKEIIGKVVEWDLEVYEVNKRGENEYRVQTSSGQSAPGAFISLYTRSPAEAQQIEGLKTGDMVKFRGQIGGTTMRNIDFDKAVLVGASPG